MSFESLGLLPELLRAVREQGYETPTPVQAKAIPIVLEGRDLLAGAQTGTGKTAGFVLPMLQRLAPHASTSTSPARHALRALILTPTRELAMQVEESVRTYGKHIPLRSTTVFGGVNINPQTLALRKGVEILVATPGRLLDHYQQGNLHFGALEVLVLDEADRMLDMGFIRDIKKILALLPAKRQNLLFSATFTEEIRQLASGLLNDPAFVDVAPRNAAAELVEQVVHPVDREKKRALLSHLIRSQKLDQVLVFTRTKHGASRLAEQLERDGIAAAAIHGNKSQPQRIKALSDFKQGQVAVLVATDIASRGLDIDQLPHVVNYELPQVPEDYVHRIGRTGRAGVEGKALSLVCVDEAKLLREIERMLKRSLPKEEIAGFTPDPTIKPEPIETGMRGRGGPRGPRPGGSRPGSNPAARTHDSQPRTRTSPRGK
jgi:ATP-dependent RNA helicase RhlE